MGLEIIKGSLFDMAGKGVVLAHGCNAQGQWGNGIAAEFRRRYPVAYEQYRKICEPRRSKNWDFPTRSPLVGTCFIVEDSDKVGCLITSNLYASQVDSPEMILAQTQTAVRDLLKLTDLEIHSNKFNSGLFRVEWEKTQAVIEEEIKVSGKDRKWVVWDNGGSK